MTLDLLSTQTAKSVNYHPDFDPNVLANISVSAPYFALKNLGNHGKDIYCEFSPELCNIAEHGPVSGAEIGRHMAILGSVVLSKENPRKEKHYYLATDAIISRRNFREIKAEKLIARARMLEINRKNGSIGGLVTLVDGTILYEVEVSYTIMSQTLFERMFMSQRMITESLQLSNPYTNDTVFESLELGSESCFANLGTVKPDDCPGHFENYPALPVARMGTSMGKLGGLHFMHLNPSERRKFFIGHAELHARQLIFAGETVRFRTEVLEPKPVNGLTIRTIAYTDQTDFIAETICNYHY
ncbi:hypothetical protein [Roseimarinus sediminis]|jgi:hypothetical protein|uniref:hypothetical protein n=1 Tax=Roseimarinus sediminis TaxID=1610899 RepID=UPI003D238D9B